MKRIFIITLFSLVAILLYSNDCTVVVDRGKQLYNSGDYANALHVFNFAIHECGNTYEIQTWINKCQQQLNTVPVSPATANNKTKTTNTQNTQSAKLNVSPTSLPFDANGYYANKYQYVYISGQGSWRATTSHSWIHIITTSGKIQVYCDKNYTYQRRYGSISISHNGKDEQTISVNQEANSKLLLSATSLTFSPDGGESLGVKVSGGMFDAKSSDAWIEIKKGQSQIIVSCKPNRNSTERNGTIDIYHDGRYEQTISIKQKTRGYPLEYYQRWYWGRLYSNDHFGESMRFVPTDLQMDWISAGISAGYPEYLQFNLNAARFRFFMMEIAPLTFSFGLTSYNWQMKYSPTIGVYFPLNTYGRNDWSMVFRIGPSVNMQTGRCWFVTELSFVHMWDCEFMANNFFIRYDGSINVGVSFDLSIPDIIY